MAVMFVKSGGYAVYPKLLFEGNTMAKVQGGKPHQKTEPLLPAEAGIGCNNPDLRVSQPKLGSELPQTQAVNSDGSGGYQLTRPAKGLAEGSKSPGISERFKGF